MFLNDYLSLLENPPREIEELKNSSAVFWQKFKNVGTHKIYLQDTDELRQVISFLYLLDNGFTPIIIPKSWSDERVQEILSVDKTSYAFIKNNITKFIQNGIDEFPAGDYGLFSSGTTGSPQIYYFDIKRGLRNAKAHAESLGIKSSDLILKVISTDHAFGICAYIWTPIILRCRIRFCKNFFELGSFNPSCSFLHLTPRQARRIIKLKSEISLPDKVSIGSDVIDNEDLMKLYEPGREIYITYGLTEAGPRVCTHKFIPTVSPQHMLGKPLEGVECRILTNDNQILETGIGQLLIKSPYLALNLTNKLNGVYLKCRDQVEIRADKSVNLITHGRHCFKVNDQLIDLNELKKQNINQIDSLNAVVWYDGIRENWALLILLNKPDTFETMNFDKTLKPSKITFKSILDDSGLGKISARVILEQLDLPLNTRGHFYRSI